MKHTLNNTSFYGSKVEAGFPSPADNYIEQELDIREYLIKNPEATFLVKATGESMNNAGILDGDILIVDRSIEPKHNSIVITSIDGELTVKRLIIKFGNEKSYLQSENSKYPNIELGLESNIKIWGVVTYAIHHII